jgi:hypothetical protein
MRHAEWQDALGGTDIEVAVARSGGEALAEMKQNTWTVSR